MHQPWHEQREDVTKDGNAKRKESANQSKSIEQEEALLHLNIEIIAHFKLNVRYDLAVSNWIHIGL